MCIVVVGRAALTHMFMSGCGYGCGVGLFAVGTDIVVAVIVWGHLRMSDTHFAGKEAAAAQLSSAVGCSSLGRQCLAAAWFPMGRAVAQACMCYKALSHGCGVALICSYVAVWHLCPSSALLAFRPVRCWPSVQCAAGLPVA